MGFWGVVGAIIVAVLILCVVQKFKAKHKNYANQYNFDYHCIGTILF